VGIRDRGTDGTICSGGDCAGVEMTSVADGEKTPPPPWGPSSFFFGLPSNLVHIVRKMLHVDRKPATRVILIAVQKSLSDEVNIRHFCGGNYTAEQALLLPDGWRPIVSHSGRRRPHLVNRRDSTVAGSMHGEKLRRYKIWKIHVDTRRYQS